MAACAAQGVFGKILIEPKAAEGDADPVFDNNSERYTFMYETMSSNRELHGTRSIYGTLSLYQTQLSKKPYTPMGMPGMQPGARDLDRWLPRILGGAEASDPLATPDLFPLAESLPLFDMLIHRDNGVFHYKNCRVNQAVFQGRSDAGEDEGNIISLGMHIIAMDEVEASWPGSEPAVPVHVEDAPYIFSQGVLTVGGTAYPFNEFKLNINNGLQVRHRNSLLPTCVFSAGRTVRLEVDSPFTAAAFDRMEALYNGSSLGTLRFEDLLRGGAGGSLEVRTTFTFPALRAHMDIPTIRGKGEIPLSLKMQAYRTASAAELTVTHDSDSTT